MSSSAAHDPVIDVSSICLAPGNTINVSGGSSISTSLRMVWGKAIPIGNTQTQWNPWDDHTTNPPTPGTMGTGNAWTISGIPLTGAGTTFKVYVWGVYDGQSGFARSAPETIVISGSGAIGSCTESAVAMRLSDVVSVGAFPRVLQIQVADADPQKPLPSELADLTSPLNLVFDEVHSGQAKSPIWVYESKTGETWRLQVQTIRGEMETKADEKRASLQGRLEVKTNAGEWIWTAEPMQLLGKSQLVPEQAELPELVVQPG